MSTKDTIITYREVSRIFNNHESTTISELEKSTEDPAESARMLAGLGAALKKLEAADQNPGVLVSPDHKVASLLQTFLAERANEKGELEELPMGGKEAKFDTNDWLGWAGGFFTWWRKIKPHAFQAAAAAAGGLRETNHVCKPGA